MKSKAIIQTILLTFCASLLIAQGTWTQMADFGGLPRLLAAGFTIGEKGYIGTGTPTWDDQFYKDFWEFDPVTNVWTQKADFGGTARAFAVGFSIENFGYLGTGQVASGSATRDFWQYDPSANTWTQKADFGGTARSFAIGFSISDKGHVGTGSSDGDYYKDFLEYTPSTTGIDELAIVNSITIYPNSASDLITFDLGNKVETTQTEIFIYNSAGVLLKKISSLHSTQLQIPVDDIGSDGMYFYTLSTND